jgi:exosortase/archaeosortase family protein
MNKHAGINILNNSFNRLTLNFRRLRTDTIVSWLTLLCAALVFHFSLLISTSAPLDFLVFVTVLWAVAWLPVEDLVPFLNCRHGISRIFFVSVVWVALIVRGLAVQSYADPYIPLYPLISVILLILFLGGFSLLPRFRETLYILSLVPVLAWLPRLVPTDGLSHSAAFFAAFFLRTFGIDIIQTSTKLTVGISAINVAGPCSGNEIMVQAFVVALLALIIFPMPKRWTRLPFLLLAPALGWIVNGLRVALLAMIASIDPVSAMNDSGMFAFFHLGEGGMVFSGLGIAAYAYAYVKVIDGQLMNLQKRVVRG